MNYSNSQRAGVILYLAASLFGGYLQIIARKRELELEERKTLAQIKYSENIFARCCACILLKQFDEFDIHMQQLSATEKEEFYSWPIASLLPNVEKNE